MHGSIPTTSNYVAITFKVQDFTGTYEATTIILNVKAMQLMMVYGCGTMLIKSKKYVLYRRDNIYWCTCIILYLISLEMCVQYNGFLVQGNICAK